MASTCRRRRWLLEELADAGLQSRLVAALAVSTTSAVICPLPPITETRSYSMVPSLAGVEPVASITSRPFTLRRVGFGVVSFIAPATACHSRTKSISILSLAIGWYSEMMQ
jgi:hypothetical protein